MSEHDKTAKFRLKGKDRKVDVSINGAIHENGAVSLWNDGVENFIYLYPKQARKLLQILMTRKEII